MIILRLSCRCSNKSLLSPTYLPPEPVHCLSQSYEIHHTACHIPNDCACSVLQEVRFACCIACKKAPYRCQRKNTLHCSITQKQYSNFDAKFIEYSSFFPALADYQYKDSFVADHELNMVACLTEVMAGVNFK